MMALALQMFSGIESDVTAPGSTAAADERWAWVALAQVPGIIGNARRYHDLLTLGAPADVFSMPRPVLAEHIGARAAEELTTFNWREAAAAQAVIAAAAFRKESRGAHYRADYPETDASLDGLHSLHTGPAIDAWSFGRLEEAIVPSLAPASR